MAKIEITIPETEDTPQSIESIEVRPWGFAANKKQSIQIGSGSNFDGQSGIWLEIAYTVQGQPVFYTRNILTYMGDKENFAQFPDPMEKFIQGEHDIFGFGDFLPQTSVFLKRETSTIQSLHGEDEVHISYDLHIEADMGSVFGHAAPGSRMLNLVLSGISLEYGVQFMRELISDLENVFRGESPHPAAKANNIQCWTFERQLNEKAYDRVSDDYQETYFENPLLKKLFDDWLKRIPKGGHILDAGCGHGSPVITSLLKDGFRVTGTDISAKMLQKASEKYPQADFLQKAVLELDYQAEFNGACSLSSLLYLDPIDLSYSLYRLYQAIKSGGWLFFFANDLHPAWRGNPYNRQLKNWMWSWTYSMKEAAAALEEHGFFKVLTLQDVTTEAGKEARFASWREYTLKEHQQFIQDFCLPNKIEPPPPPDVSKIPDDLSYEYVIIAQRKNG